VTPSAVTSGRIGEPTSGRARAGDYESVAGSLARGGLWSLAGQAVSYGSVLVATPVTLRLLRPAVYGLWSVLQSMLRWVGLADLGMAQASTRVAGQRRADGDQDGEVCAIWTAAAITVCLTAAAAAIVALAARPVLSTLVGIRGPLLGPGATALQILCVALVAQAVAGTLNTPQTVRLRWGSLTVVSSGSAALRTIGIPVALALVAGGVVTAAAVALAAALLWALGTVIVAVRLQPRMRRPRLKLAMAQKLLRFGGPLTISGVAAIPLTTAERLLLAHYRSTTEVAYYAVAASLGTILIAIPTAVAAPLFPALVALEGSDRAASTAIYRQSLQGVFLVMTPFVLLLAFLAHPFLALWAGPPYAQGSTGPFYVVLVGAWFNALAQLPYSYLLASGNTAVIARIHVLELVPYVLAAALLTSTLGALGAAVVWSARVIVDALVFFVSARRKGKLPIAPLSSRSRRSLAAPAALGAVLLALAAVVGGLAARAGIVVGLLAVYAPLVWFAVLTERERIGLRSLVAAAVPALRGAHAR